jgi:hypothetical protein
MARFAGGFRTAGAGSTTLPVASLFAPAAANPLIYEIGVFNTTAVAVAIALRRATALGTPGTGRDELFVDDEGAASSGATAGATLVDTHTVAPTFITGNLRVASLGAAIGSGVIWTFGERGLRIPSGTGNGVCIVPLTGTGQILDIYVEWSE